MFLSEDVQEMKKQLKAMNDKNMTYMQQNLDLEEVGWGGQVLCGIEV